MALKIISNVEIPFPSETNNPATKQYVDNKFVPGKQKLLTTNTISANITLSDVGDNDGWLIYIRDSVEPGNIKLPSMDSFGINEMVTYEVLVRCVGEETDTISLSFVDYDNNVIEFLGDTTTNIPRGYTYFLVLRNFPYKTVTVDGESAAMRQWVGNVQGKVKIPL